MSHPDEEKQVGQQMKGNRTRRRGGASDRLLVARRVREPASTHRARVEAKKEEKKKETLSGRQSMHVGVSCICSSPPCNGKGKGVVLVMFLVADQWEGDEQK